MKLRPLLLQLLLGANAFAHALPDDFDLPHSLHRRMPPARPPPPNSPSPSNPRAGRVSNQAVGPPTGAQAQYVEPVTGRPIEAVNPVTGSSREGFDPLTGQLNDLQLGASQGRRERIRDFGRRMRAIIRPGRQREAPSTRGDDIAPSGPLTSPQQIPEGPQPGSPRSGNQNPDAALPATPPGHPPSPPPDYFPRPPSYLPRPPSPRQLSTVERRGKRLDYYSREARLKERDWKTISAKVTGEWPAINIDRDYVVRNTLASPEQSEPWMTFLTDPMVTGPGSLGPWTRTTVSTRADDPELLLDLAVNPSQNLVVFIKIPSDESLQFESNQRLLSELLHQSLRRLNPRNRHGFDKFLYPDPPTDSEIARAQLRVAFAADPIRGGYHVIARNSRTMEDHWFEFTGSLQATPISYMITKHPGDVAGEITEFVSIGGRKAGRGKAVLIKLGNYYPEANRHGAPRQNAGPPQFDDPPPPSMLEAQNRGFYLEYKAKKSLMSDQNEWPAISARVDEEWPAINIDTDYAFENIPGPPQLAEQWKKFTTGRNLGPWTRITVKTKADDSQPLLDLAVYPQNRLVVFIKTAPDSILRWDDAQRLHSRLIHQALRGFGADFRPTEFLFPRPPPNSDIGVAQSRATAFSEAIRTAVNSSPSDFRHMMAILPPLRGDHVIRSGNPFFLGHFHELIGSRQTAPISYMIEKNPGEVAGPIGEVVLLKEPDGGRGKAVLIRLVPQG